MEHKSRLHRYYLYGLLPTIIIASVIAIFATQFEAFLYLVGFTWPYLYYTPGFEEKATSATYRFALLGNLFNQIIKVVFHIRLIFVFQYQ